MLMIGLGERIKKAAETIGGLDHLAPRLTDVSRRTLSDWANDKTEPRASVIAAIAQITGADAAWLITGEGSPKSSFTDSADSDAFIRLPVYNEVAASAGPGALAVSEHPDSVVAFARRFLRDQGAVPERCSIIRARGDSMAPTIPDASLLIVDHSQAEVANGCIMVISVGDDLLVKRVRRRLDGLIDLVSDNPSYPPETIGSDTVAQLRVVGRVVYFCRTP